MSGLPRLHPPLTDGVVALREWTHDDVTAMAQALNEPEIARWTGVPSPYTPSDGEDFLREVEERRRAGTELALAVVAASDGGLLGSISVRVWTQDCRGELGYLLFAPARGQGAASRAVRLLAQCAFERLGLMRVGILAATGNAASQGVAERAGFTREGVLRAYMDRRGEALDMVSYSLLPEDL